MRLRLLARCTLMFAGLAAGGVFLGTAPPVRGQSADSGAYTSETDEPAAATTHPLEAADALAVWTALDRLDTPATDALSNGYVPISPPLEHLDGEATDPPQTLDVVNSLRPDEPERLAAEQASADAMTAYAAAVAQDAAMKRSQLVSGTELVP